MFRTFIKQSGLLLKQKPYFIFMLDYKNSFILKQAHPPSCPLKQSLCFKQEILSLMEEL